MNKKVRDIIVLVGVSIVLLASLVLLYMVLFTKVFFNDDKPTAGNHGIVGQPPIDMVDDSEILELKVRYEGGELFAGGSVIAEDFIVEAVYKDGSVKHIKNYECVMMSEDYRLKEGSNTLVFYYGRKSAVITLEAVNVRSAYIFAPTYILHKGNGHSEDTVNQIEAGSLTYKEALAGVAFTGDSQIKALETYRILDANTVEALVGASADYLEQNFSTVVTKAYGKDALIVHYGINSLSVSENERSRRVEQYKDLLLRLKEELPETRIIVSGVFPVSDRIYYNKGSFAYINQYNFDLLDMCMEIGVEYYSNNEYMTNHQEVFSADGLHLEYKFYNEYWLKDLITTLKL